MSKTVSSKSTSRSALFCECTNCTARFTDDIYGVGTIRCPECGLKNVEISGPRADEGVDSRDNVSGPGERQLPGPGHRGKDPQ